MVVVGELGSLLLISSSTAHHCCLGRFTLAAGVSAPNNRCPVSFPSPRTECCSTCLTLWCRNRRGAHTSRLLRSPLLLSSFSINLVIRNGILDVEEGRFCSIVSTFESGRGRREKRIFICALSGSHGFSTQTVRYGTVSFPVQ